MDIHRSDLDKILDAMVGARDFHRLRDEMNAKLHMGVPRYCPLTSTLMTETDRLIRLLGYREEK